MRGRLPALAFTATCCAASLLAAVAAAPPAQAEQPTGAEQPVSFESPHPAPIPGPGADWAVDLGQGEPTGVAFTAGALRLTAPTGLLLLPSRRLAHPVGRVSTDLDAQVPAGASVAVDVRARLPTGNWSEWLPEVPGRPTQLRSPSEEVQTRLVLTAAGPPAPSPEVRGLRVRTEVVAGMRVAALGEPVSYRVVATREGLVSGTTANGHKIRDDDLFVALPSRRVLAARNGSEYSVKVCSVTTCAWAPVWDVGPWNIDDDYWGEPRTRWPDLPRGLPQAQAAFRDGHNDGEDGFGRTVANPAGIDLADGLFTGALGLAGTGPVTVTYLWTGRRPLSPVNADPGQDGPAHRSGLGIAVTLGTAGGKSGDRARDHDSGNDYVTVRRAPAPDAAKAGIAADHAGVAVQCDAGNGWLRIGPGEFLPADTVTLVGVVDPC